MEPADRPADLNPPRASHSYGPPMAYEGGGDDPAAYAESAGPPTPRINARLVWRAVRRHWWQSLFIWAVGSAALMVIAYYRIKPTYEAYTHIKVEQGDQKVFHENGATIDFSEYKETQVAAVTQPNVLSTALAEHPELLTLPRLAAAEDPEAEIRQALSVLIIPKTSLIRVAMSSEFPNEAAQVVNAVTLAYVKTAMDANSSENEMRLKRLREEHDKRKSDVELARQELVKLSTELAAGDKEVLKDRDKLTADSYAAFSFQLTDVQIKRMAAQTHLQELENERPAAAAGRPNPADRAQRRVESMVNRDPRVIALKDKIDKARESAGKANSTARGGNDPAVVQHNSRAQALLAQLAKLREELRVEVAEELAAGDPAGGDAFERDVEAARSDVRRLTNLEKSLTDALRKLDVENKNSGSNLLKLEFARSNLDTAGRVLDAIRSNLDQAEFEAKSPMARLRREFPARASNRPTSNNRVKVMAASPICLMATIVGLLVLMELQASRVGDPDDLPRRVHLNVLGVVPPLPQVHNPEADGRVDRNGHAPPPRTPAQEAKSQRQLDEFVQSLDHLRVALCAGAGHGTGERRCILITSASGSEGKTTLAAQLAERCINAGLMTLLIDADLRNPTLSRVLDVANLPGLVNVLRNELTTEEALTVIGGAGGFHLLPAGTPRVDPSSILAGDRLGKLLAQARESFDIVIVDAPPVLPVPDALTIGRWTDGAVLAVRYDTSRFPLVDRANQRLASVGVPVIGAVVNGVPSTHSGYYGGYYPTVPSEGEPAPLDA